MPYRTAFALWIVGTVAYVLFSVVVVLPDRAHYAGEFFLLFVACAWLAYARAGWRARSPGELVGGASRRCWPSCSRRRSLPRVAILPDATVRPFAPDRTLAEAADDAGLARDVVSGQDFDGATMAGYLDRPVWSIARDEPMRFFVNDEREAVGNEDLTPTSACVCAASGAAQRRHRPVALVVDKPVPTPAGVALLVECAGGAALPGRPRHGSAPTADPHAKMAAWTSRCGSSTPGGGSASSPTAPIPSTRSRSSRWSSVTWPARAGCSTSGCGEGQIARRVAAAGALVVGVDPTAAQIVEAQARGGGPVYARADADHLPHPDGAFDAVVMCLVIEHLDPFEPVDPRDGPGARSGGIASCS